MGRPKKEAGFNEESLLTELIDLVVGLYETHDHDLSAVSSETGISLVKVRKLLITAGIRRGCSIYVFAEKTRPLAEKILALHAEGKRVDYIMKVTGLTQSAVYTYLPYARGVYKKREVSRLSERVRTYRLRKVKRAEFLEKLSDMPREDADESLWMMIQLFQGCPFKTQKGFNFRYKVMGNGIYIDRKDSPIAKSSIMMAFHKARKLQEEKGHVRGPKELGTFGDSYIYPIFLRLGICTEKADAEGGAAG